MGSDWEEVVKVTTHLACWPHHRFHAELRHVRFLGGQHAHLNIATDIQLILHALPLRIDQLISFVQGIQILLKLYMCLGPRLQNQCVDRLLNVISSTQLKPFCLILVLILGGQENDRDICRRRISLKLLADLIAIHLRHHDVEQNQVGRLSFGNFQCNLAIDGCLYDVIFAQHTFNNIQILWSIVNRKHDWFI